MNAMSAEEYLTRFDEMRTNKDSMVDKILSLHETISLKERLVDNLKNDIIGLKEYKGPEKENRETQTIIGEAYFKKNQLTSPRVNQVG